MEALGQTLEYPPSTLLDVPQYRPARLGRWQLERGRPDQWVRGYFTGLQFVAENWVLYRNPHNFREGKRRDIWMSITPMERESLAHHAWWAEGTVVVAGLGMGLLLYNLAQNPRVTSITVLEREPAVVDLLQEATGFRTEWFSSGPPLRVLTTSAMDWKPDHQVHTLLVDIWPQIAHRDLVADTQTLQKRIIAKQVLSWGQELAFMRYVNRAALAPSRDSFQRWRLETGVPWAGLEHDPDYVTRCLQALRQCRLAASASR